MCGIAPQKEKMATGRGDSHKTNHIHIINDVDDDVERGRAIFRYIGYVSYDRLSILQQNIK